MILIELEGGGTPRFRLEFHPRFTVVAGLEPEQRKELAASISAALRGEAPRMQVSVDVGGEAQELTNELVRSLGLEHLAFDNVVGVADLPVASASASTEAPVAPEPEPEPVQENIALAEARKELDAARQLATDLEGRIQRAGTPPPPVDDSELERAAMSHSRARQQMEEIQTRLTDMGIIKDELPLPDQLAQAQQVLDSITQRIEDLKRALAGPEGDPEAIQRGREKARNAEAVMSERNARTSVLAQTAGQWTRVMGDLVRLAAQPRPPQWLIAQTKDEFDEASARVKAFSYQMNEGIDVGPQLERAQRQLNDAQAAWDEIEHGVEGQLAILEEQRDELYSRVKRIFGDEISYDQVVDALEREHKHTQEAPHPMQDLVDALTPSGAEVTYDNALEEADKWFAAHEQVGVTQAENQKALASAMLDIRDIQQKVQDLQARIAEPTPPTFDYEEQRRELADATTAESDASIRLTELQAAKQRANEYDLEALPALAVKLGDARTALEAAKRKFDYFHELESQRLSSRIAPPAKAGDDWFLGNAPEAQSNEADASESAPSETVGVPWWEGGRAAPGAVAADMSNVSHSRIEAYLLSRASALRLVARGESIPLVIDSVLEGVAQEAAIRTLTALAKVSPFVQVVYLSGNDLGDKWAKKQDIYTAAVVRLERA